jgi:hypothetical protein
VHSAGDGSDVRPLASDTFPATIHDGLLVKPEDVDYAYGVMTGEMNSLGMNLKELKVKRY